jgi:MULE transposase domain
MPRRRIYACTRGRKYMPRKEAHTEESRNAEHNTGNCQFRVNTYRRKNDNLVYITKVENQHNHKLVETIAILAPSYRKFTPEMQEDVRLLATCGVRSGAIIEVLQHKNPGKYIHDRDIYNLVNSIRREQNQSKSDAGSIYLNLMKQQQENPSFHVDAQFEGQENRLVRLCWMRPSQQELWARFHDIVLLDTTAKTNRHSMILCVVIIVDNHNRSRLVATAILSDETKDSFTWLFQSLLDATGGLMPRLLYTDADPAMIASVNNSWPTTKHHFCIFHIRKNLEKHFMGKYYGEKWRKFFAAFCRARNSRVESIFEERWAALITEYPDAANYLQRYLYQCREAWVLCFTHRAFNAGIQSTQRVESYNGIIKNHVSGSSSLIELESVIERLLSRESRFISLNETICKLPASQDEDYHNYYFKEVDISCQKYLTPAILKLQRHEMNRSMHYRCQKAILEDELGKRVCIRVL